MKDEENWTRRARSPRVRPNGGNRVSQQNLKPQSSQRISGDRGKT